jgi:hypothetical protein
MNMLTQHQVELIHREIDGENSPEASAEVRELVLTQPEALTLMTSLQSLDAMLRQVPAREPSPALRQAIHDAMPLNPVKPKQTITRWAVRQLNGFSTFMEETMLTKKVLIGATTAVAVIAIIGNALVGYPPSIFDAGTIGANDGISGVQQAGRYQGKKTTEADVTLSSPEVQALLQNDKVLELVKSEAFRSAMRNDQFRMLAASAEYRNLQKNAEYQQLMANPAYLQLAASAPYQELMATPAYHELAASAAYQSLMAQPSYKELTQSAAYQDLMAKEAFRNVLNSEAFRSVAMSDASRAIARSDAWRSLERNNDFRMVAVSPAFRVVAANETFRSVAMSPAFRSLEQSEAFRQVAHNASLSEAFLVEASRFQQ